MAGVAPAFYLGVFGVVVAHRLASSSEAFHEVSDAAPTGAGTRSTALFLACLLPATIAGSYLAVVLVSRWITPPPPASPWFGTVPAVEVWTILLGSGVVAAFGGPALGVLVARWTRFPGAGAISAVLLVALVMALGYVSGPELSNGFGGPAVLHLVAPWVLWGSGSPDGTIAVLAAGSAAWHALYQVGLCGLAVLGAVLATPPRDRRLVTAFGVTAAVAAICLVLAMTTGNPAPVEFRIR